MDDAQGIARILKYGGGQKGLFFNYNNRLTDVWGSTELAEVRQRFGCTTRYPSADRPGIGISLL